jgi:hypothetical protein
MVIPDEFQEVKRMALKEKKRNGPFGSSPSMAIERLPNGP